MTLREEQTLIKEVAEFLYNLPSGMYWWEGYIDKSKALLSLIQKWIEERLKVMGDEEIMRHANDEVAHAYGYTRDVILSGAHVLIQAQHQSDLNQIKELLKEG